MANPTLVYKDSYGQEIVFHIPDGVRNICVNLSGGADSAILLFMIIQYCENFIEDANIHLITCANTNTGWYNSYFSAKVIDKILELTKTELIKTHYTYYAKTQDRSEITDLEVKMCNEGIADFFVHGITQNPSLDITELNEGRFEKRDPGVHRHVLKPRVYDGITHLRWQPFTLVDKRMVKYLYDKFDLLDELYPYTRSCEIDHWNSEETPWMKSHCGECWWCKERQWAFGRII